MPYCPPCVHLAVVDPGVGTNRRQVAIITPGGALVGPDNGLLMPAADALGGITAAHELTEPDYRLPTVSATFHGRDVFAPAAAHLAAGADLGALGPALEVGSLVRISVPRPQVAAGQIRCGVLAIDRFGNVQLTAKEEDLARAGLDEQGEIQLDTDEAGAISLRRSRTFDDVRPGQAALIVDSAGWLAAAVNGGNLAEALRIGVGDPVILSPIG